MELTKHLLFVDDDQDFLNLSHEMFIFLHTNETIN